MVDKIVLLDLDETLIYSRSPVDGCIDVMWEGQKGYTKVRPSAEAFLIALKEKGYTIMSLTQGVVAWQIECLKALNLLHYFEGIYGRTDLYGYSHIAPPLADSRSVLVDNLSAYELRQKADWIEEGGATSGSCHFIRCVSFEGHEDTEDSLLELLPEIDEFLNG